MGKSTHFIGQPILGQLLNFLEKEKIIYPKSVIRKSFLSFSNDRH